MIKGQFHRKMKYHRIQIRIYRSELILDQLRRDINKNQKIQEIVENILNESAIKHRAIGDVATNHTGGEITIQQLVTKSIVGLRIEDINNLPKESQFELEPNGQTLGGNE